MWEMLDEFRDFSTGVYSNYFKDLDNIILVAFNLFVYSKLVKTE